VLVLAIATGLYALGEPLGQQLQALRTSLPKAWQSLHAWLDRSALGQRMLEGITGAGEDLKVPWPRIAVLAGSTLHALAAFVLAVLMGVYLALDVRRYRRGFLSLVPPQHRERIADALDASGRALSRWLVGQGVIMIVLGASVAIGLSLLKMPLALALGVIAGLLEFVPFFGPVASGLLAVLVAFAQGPEQALWVAGLFVVVQQVENHLLVPLVQRWAAQLPPVLTLAGVVVFATLFGPLGVMLGTPLTVVARILVLKLYVAPMEGPTAGTEAPSPSRTLPSGRS
jgi:predicted PurR-regulated permease PerM